MFKKLILIGVLSISAIGQAQTAVVDEKGKPLPPPKGWWDAFIYSTNAELHYKTAGFSKLGGQSSDQTPWTHKKIDSIRQASEAPKSPTGDKPTPSKP